MWIDIQAGPIIMVVLWWLFVLGVAALMYGFARISEYAAAHMGEARAAPGEVWGWSDFVLGLVLALLFLVSVVICAYQLVIRLCMVWPNILGCGQ